MKPIHLSMQAFGAFAGTVEIDFAALAPHGLFLVSGETGTGKTTIFDAMCWALYGTMPRKQSHEVRSDHVDEATRCEVVFTFESGGDRYTVTRNPEQLRPSKKNSKSLVKEDASATLVRITDDGAGTDPVATRVSNVTRACEAIIGLDDNQFQRVILLPQGDFDRFLQANSKEREEILERLFGGEVYDRIVERLKATRDARVGQLGDVESAIEAALDMAQSHVDHADAALADADAQNSEVDDDRSFDEDVEPIAEGTDEPVTAAESAPGEPAGTPGPDEDGDQDETLVREHLEAAVTRLDAELAQRTADLTTANEVRAAAQAGHDRAVAAAGRFDAALDLRARIADLQGAAETVEAARVAAVVSRQIRPIVDADDAVSTAVEAHRDATEKRDVRRTRIVGVLADLGAPDDDLEPLSLQKQHTDLTAGHTADAEKLAQLHTAEAALQRARQALTERVEAADKAVADRTEAITRIETIDNELPSLRDAKVDPDSIVAAIDSAKQATRDRAALTQLMDDLKPLSQESATADAEHRALLQGFSDTQAPRLATTLTEGEPCPVCGSLDHPEPASTDDTRVIAWEDVTAASDRRAALLEDHRSLESQITALRATLGDSAELDIEVLRSRVEEKLADLDAARSVVTRIAELDAERATLAVELDRLTNEMARLGEARDQATREVADAEKAADSALEHAAGIDPDDLERRGALLVGFGDLLEGYDTLVSAVTTAASLEVSRRADLAGLLEGSEHDDLAVVRSLLVPADQEQAAIDDAAEHRSSHDRALGELKTLEDQGIPAERPDPSQTEVVFAAAEAVRQRCESLVSTLHFDVNGATTSLARADDLEADSAGLRDHAQAARHAYAVCAQGGPALPVPLKRWVLAHELDRITAAANVHLAAMTHRRYGLRRQVNQQDGRRSFGLDLEVDDSNTGRPRSTSSLSGGEQFQASLALALGLADVISQGGTSSGQHFEALFVDEGFGSLSAEALDDAVATLYRLHETGRMVGAITHVESMKKALPVGIEVTHDENGPGSKVTVTY